MSVDVDPNGVDQLFDPGRGVVRSICTLPDHLSDVLREIAFSNSIEICGLISTEYKIYNVENIHDEPTHNFLMEKESFIQAVSSIHMVAGLHVLGVFHTHPNGVTWPTPRDIAGWPNPELKWKYWIATSREVIEWSIK